MKFLCLAAVLTVGLSATAYAQERAASSAMETQMTWSALSAQVKDAVSRSNAVALRIDQSERCNEVFKVYAPRMPGAINGCIPNGLIKLVNERIDGVKTDLDATNKALDTLDKRVTSEVKRLDGNISSVTADLKKLSKHVDDVEIDLKKGIEALNTRVNTVVADITGLKTRMGVAETDINKLETRTTKNEGDVRDINIAVTKINVEIAAIKSAAAALAATVDDNSRDITKIIACGKKSMFFNGTGCVASPVVESTQSCKTDVVKRSKSVGTNLGGSFSNGDASCPAGYKLIGTETNTVQTARTSERTESTTTTTSTCLGMICK